MVLFERKVQMILRNKMKVLLEDMQMFDSRQDKAVGPKDWGSHMVKLAMEQKNVKWKKKHFVVQKHYKMAYKKMNRIRKEIANMPSDIISLIPSARWIFDNFQMVYREIKNINSSETDNTSLPVLTKTEWKGFPRVYLIAKKMVDISGGYLNEENIALMIEAYQQEITLTSIEIYILPTFITLCLLKQILYISEKITKVIKTKAAAGDFVKQHPTDRKDFYDISYLMKDISPYNDNIYFHCHVIYLLNNMSIGQEAIQKYILYHFKEGNGELSISDIFIEEGKKETILEAAIRNPITSLRELNHLDKEVMFNRLSSVEHILLKDPDNIYSGMDSESVAHYRSVIEKLSKKHNIEESVIAEHCVELAIKGRSDLNNSHHVGTYLIGKGSKYLKESILNKKIRSYGRKKIKAMLYFLLNIPFRVLIFSIVIFAVLKAGYSKDIVKIIVFLLLGAPFFFKLSQKIVNMIMTKSIPATVLPAMDYSDYIPDDARTFVVMPVIVSNKEQGLEYLERLRKHYLANKQSNLHFALLADYTDSANKENQDDEIIRDALISRINQLNKEYPSPLLRFSLFMRERLWNHSEGCFMCWERKRGKLEEFNSILNGQNITNTSFCTTVCDKEFLTSFKYVITLDADSDLLMDNASKLVGVINHPLNRAILDEDEKTVKEGYVIIQPHIINHIDNESGGVFHRIFSDGSGLSSYSMATSEVYQDVFNEGIFVGKGIYDVRAFHQLLHNVFPENRVLSHDLLESCYAKTGYSSTTNIMESFPSSVISYARREHRWVRGDWQLIPWLFKRELSCLSKWKIKDNLLSSLVPLSKLFIIFANILLFPNVGWLWISLISFPLALDLVVLLYDIAVRKIIKFNYTLVYKELYKEIKRIVLRTLFDIVLIPFSAMNSVDAIGRTLYRHLISKKNFLMWNSADNVEKTMGNSLKSYFYNMWYTIIPSILLMALLFVTKQQVLGIILYGSLALVWGMSFIISYKISQSNKKVSDEICDKDDMLLDISRDIWGFFRDFCTQEDNWLCPDNYQVKQKEKITHKTSPTNIGLQLLSIMSARDFGFETLTYTIDLIENVLYTVSVLPKWEGHLYNWYDTETLEILNPHYVSTVDSGNYFGHLITLKNGLMHCRNNVVIKDVQVKEINNLLKKINGRVRLHGNYNLYSDFLDDINAVREEINNVEDARKPLLTDFNRASEFIIKEIEELGLGEYSFSKKPTLCDLASDGNIGAHNILNRINLLSETIDHMVKSVDFSKLFNGRRKLFYIGFNVMSQTYDNGCYDLIASESILTSLFAIAKGDITVKHWKRLGRPFTVIRGIPAHVSWSGTMFEYLMPNLVIKEYKESVFADSSRAAVLQQIRYAAKKGIPWGISESQYYRFDINHNYQYKAFGVPKLRLQPVYSDSLVIAPYASILALEYNNKKVIANLQRLREIGAYGKYGFFEAIDFNVPDPIRLTNYCIVRSFMAHHQGMSLVAINNYINNGIMRKRFHSEPMVKAVEAFLEEKRNSRYISMSRKGYTIDFIKKVSQDEDVNINRYIKNTDLSIPATNYLSNSTYSLLITSDGDGFSRCDENMMYRWRPDIYSETGFYIYVRDVEQQHYWSTCHNPVKVKADEYQVIFTNHSAEYIRRDGDIITCTEVTLSSEDNIEVRKVTVKNNSQKEKQIEITSYMELVIDRYDAEASHPAFNKLFIESEYVKENNVLISTRRGGSNNKALYFMHMINKESARVRSVEYECNRMRFIGRNRTLKNPYVIEKGIPLSNDAKFSGDPIASFRVCISVEAGEEACVTFINGLFESKEALLQASDELSVSYKIQDIIQKFRLQSDMELKYLNITGKQLSAFQKIISQIYYPTKHFRGPSESIRRNWKDKNTLWRFMISGDYPILLLSISSINDMQLVKDVLKLYEYMGMNSVEVDLVILAVGNYGYVNELSDMLNSMTSSLRIFDGGARETPGIFILHSYQLNPAEMDLLFTVAKVVFTNETGIFFRNVDLSFSITSTESNFDKEVHLIG